MNSILPIYDDSALEAWPNANELKSSYHEVTRALRNGTKYVLITGKSKNGKSKLLFTIAKEISTHHRLIYLRGKDLRFSDELIVTNTHSDKNVSEKTCASDFNLLLELIIESIPHYERITIIIDDADKLALDKLTRLLNIYIDDSSEHRSLQFILTGLPRLKKQLRPIKCLTESNFLHSSIDRMENKTVRSVQPSKINREELNINWCRVDHNTKVSNTKDASKTIQSSHVLNKSISNLVDDIDIPKKIKSFKNKTHAFVQRIIQSIHDYMSMIKSRVNIIVNDYKFNISKCTQRAIHKIVRLLTKFFVFESNALAKFPRNTLISFKRKFEDIKNMGLTVNCSEGWNTNSVLMVLVLSVVFIVAIQSQSSEIQDKYIPEMQLTDNSKNSSIADQSDIIIKKKKLTPKIEPTPRNNELHNIFANTSNQTSAFNKVSIDTIDILNLNMQHKDPVKESEVHSLLGLAAQQIEEKKLTTPDGDNAYETYQFILFTHPEHSVALAGIKRIHDKYLNWANHSLKANKIKQAKRFFNKALAIEPNNKLTLLALEELKKRETNPISRKNLKLLTEREPEEAQQLLNRANDKLLEIELDVRSNKRDYRKFLDVQLSYQKILKRYPHSEAAQVGLTTIKNLYYNWAELESQNENHHTSSFLYNQAKSLKLDDTNINQSNIQSNIVSKS